jgi:DNA-binding transcriptional ArsR family regulator
MKDGPVIATIAALIGDPARANMLTALLDGRALTVTELAGAANVTLQTASGHLTKLHDAGLLIGEKQGRHRFFRLSGDDIAQVLEALMGVAQRTGAVRVRTGPRDDALRTARVCYDHLAGERGVDLMNGLVARGLIEGDDTPVVTDEGRGAFAAFGIDLTALETARRPVCRRCLDWSERRSHLGGGLGAAILSSMIQRGWVVRIEGRVLRFTALGQSGFVSQFG